MDEFELIRQYFLTLTPTRKDVRLGIGDDAALLKLPAGHELAVTTDTLVAGTHYAEDATAYDIGWKSLAANLSDLAAMGAEPRWFTLALTLRMVDNEWLKGFAAGLRDLAAQSGIALVGGDTTQGPPSITITAMGTVPAGKALRRSGAKVGDVICVTGTLGDAALALRGAGGGAIPEALHERLVRPTPRNEIGIALRELAHAAIDLSDGLAGDLSHILEASGVGAEVRLDALPMSEDFRSLTEPSERLALQAGGGDDYELCICLPASDFKTLKKNSSVPLTQVGKIVKTPGLKMLDAKGKAVPFEAFGYRHFS